MNFEKLYINGEYVDSASGEFIEVINPATEEVIAKVPRGNEEDVNKAAKAAREAFETFKHSTLDERVEIIKKFHAYLKENEDEITVCISKELGSPLGFTKKVHLGNQIDRIERYIEIAQDYEYERKEKNTLILKEPIGVVGAITPWNYPLGQIVQKIIFGILTGNAIILKPSKQTPLIAYYVVDGLEKAGLPKGVLNLVTGQGSEVGNAIATNPEVDLVSFTGSTKGGIEVAKLAIDSVKRTALELGGKSPAVFLDDTYLEEGIKAMLGTIFNNTGQTCSAWSRAIVLNAIKDQFEEKLVELFGYYKVGMPDDPETKVGPLSSQKQYDKVTKYIEQGKKEARVLIENEQELPEKGYFVHPIVFADVDNDSEIAQEEIFGPVLSVIYVDSVEEAIEKANDVIYGLSGAVFGEPEEAFRVAKEIKSGTVTVNDANPPAGVPFGGYKMSGNGREGGVEGLEEYLETKTMPIVHEGKEK